MLNNEIILFFVCIKEEVISSNKPLNPLGFSICYYWRGELLIGSTICCWTNEMFSLISMFNYVQCYICYISTISSLTCFLFHIVQYGIWWITMVILAYDLRKFCVCLLYFTAVFRKYTFTKIDWSPFFFLFVAAVLNFRFA